MGQRLTYLAKTYLLTVLLFVAAKVVFMLCNSSGHDVMPADVWAVIDHGLTLDLSTALYFLILPFLVCLASMWVRIPRWLLRIYYAIIALAFSLAFVSDTSLYQFWGFKLDASCLQYLSQPEGITQSVSAWYLLVRFLIGALVAWGIYRAYLWGKLPHPATSSRIRETVLFVCLMPVMVIGIRGGLTESTTNIGQVYYSQNQFLNHSAVNPVFSFLYSLSHQLGDLSEYEFFDEQECQRIVADVYTTESAGTDTLLTTLRPNIVILLLESCGEEFASAMPRLQQLKKEGVYFSRCYGNTWRTDRGTVCALSGYPSFPGLSIMKMPEKSRTLPGIANTLKSQGYQTSYIYGGDINFTNMRSYLISTGWEHLCGMDDFTASERNTAQWGVRDDITFQTVFRQIQSFKPGTMNLIGYSSLSSHEPWDVPLQRHADEVLNAFAYLDDCLADFIGHLQQTPAWDNLLVILTADHGINYGKIDQSKPLEKNHIPMLWLGGAVREPRTIDAICNQSDLAATLLGQMGLTHDDFTFSRDVLSTSYSYPTAVHNYNNAQLLIDSTGHILYDFDARRFIINRSADAERMLLVNKAILQCTTHDLSRR